MTDIQPRRRDGGATVRSNIELEHTHLHCEKFALCGLVDGLMGWWGSSCAVSAEFTRTFFSSHGRGGGGGGGVLPRTGLFCGARVVVGPVVVVGPFWGGGGVCLS